MNALSDSRPPSAVARGLTWVLRHVGLLVVRAIYRIRAHGAERLPSGGALLVCNHVSFADAVLLGACLFDRPVRFLMYRGYYEMPVVGALARAFGAIPVASGDDPEILEESLARAAEHARRGELVCIFAEGAITRSGVLQPFRRGLERIARRADVPIVPVWLDRVWGSVFSWRGGKPFRKFPRHLPYRIGVHFGAPLPSDSEAWRVRDAVQELGAGALQERGTAHTLGERFLRVAKHHGHRPAVADSSGVRLSYRRFLIAALVLRARLADVLPAGRNVGILLPASSAGALANVATVLLGKVPVNLNATLGNAELEDSLLRADAAVVLTSRIFLRRLRREPPFAGEAGRTLFVEDLTADVGVLERARAALASLLPSAWLARRCGLERDSAAPAAILFSSGSTGRPKGVVLSHSNIGSNARALTDVLRIGRGDVVLGVLPFFHSFGLTGTLWTPLLSGGQVAYHPDPLDAKGVAAWIGESGATVAMATPSFYRSYLRRLDRETAARLRLCFCGAERLDPALAEAWRDKLGTELLEGYGCTEASPVVSVNRPPTPTDPDGFRAGTLGQALPGVALRVVDLDSGEVLGPDREGLLLVRGPNVMTGYLDDPEATAAALEDGWYRTGDVARVDRDGFLTLTDRLARFSKIGGEMVPHGRVEQELAAAAQRLAPAAAAPATLHVTSVADPRKGERLVVLCADLAVPPETLVEELRRGGLPNLFVPRPDAFVTVEGLPHLASGKVDLRAARELARGDLPGAPSA